MTGSIASFTELVARLRAGDETAATEVVRLYEPAIRRAVRFRLANSPLHRLMDSLDLCQSVLASFLLRASAGQYEISEPEQLARLLVAIARNKLAMHARAQQRQCRDNRREQALGEHLPEPAGGDPTPSQQVSGRELLEMAERLMSADERQLLQFRREGLGWNTIADRVGNSPDALRKKLSRALDTVAHQLKLDDYSDS